MENKTIIPAQHWYEQVLDSIRKERALQQKAEIAGNSMYLYHKGKMEVYESVATTLIWEFKVSAVEIKDNEK